MFVGVDAPDFNLDLERALKARGIPTVHFVCPSVWAWRPERVQALKLSTDHVLCIFPFEPALLAQHGVPSTYVGHPLAPHIPMSPDRSAARVRLGLPGGAPVIALLPGSRAAEVEHLAPRFLSAAQLILEAKADAHFVLPAVPHLKQRLERLVHTDRMSPAELLASLERAARTARCRAAAGTADPTRRHTAANRLDPLLLVDEPGLPTRPNPVFQPSG